MVDSILKNRPSENLIQRIVLDILSEKENHVELSVTTSLIALLLTSRTPQANSRSTENSSNTQAVKKGTMMEQVRNCYRSMLHKVESYDGPIKQIYETASKDDCLHTMYAEGLENIWQIPAVEDYNSNHLHRSLLSPVGLCMVVRHTAYKTSFATLPTEQYFKKKVSTFPENRSPDFLPKPKGKEMPPEYGGYYPCQKNDPIKELIDYYWRGNGREVVTVNNGSGAIQASAFYGNTEMGLMGH